MIFASQGSQVMGPNMFVLNGGGPVNNYWTRNGTPYSVKLFDTTGITTKFWNDTAINMQSTATASWAPWMLVYLDDGANATSAIPSDRLYGVDSGFWFIADGAAGVRSLTFFVNAYGLDSAVADVTTLTHGSLAGLSKTLLTPNKALNITASFRGDFSTGGVAGPNAASVSLGLTPASVSPLYGLILEVSATVTGGNVIPQWRAGGGNYGSNNIAQYLQEVGITT